MCVYPHPLLLLQSVILVVIVHFVHGVSGQVHTFDSVGDSFR